MKIISLTLVGYRGFKLRNIKHFEYRPSEKTQIILGTNGSGKSSMLKELSPLPGLPADYTKGGRKEIVIEHNKKTYVLQSLFEPDGNRFIFCVDGENLNPGYTVTVYRELVKFHFNYTQDIHAVLTGSTKFHSMSPNERRVWFMNLSEEDYTYALKYFQRLKDRVRDLQGALKLNQSRLNQELEKCIKLEDEVKIRDEIRLLTQKLSFLIAHRKPKHASQEEDQNTIKNTEESLESLLSQANELLVAFDEQKCQGSPEMIQARIQKLNVSIQVNQQHVSHHGKQLESILKQLGLAQETSSLSVEEIDAKIASLTEEERHLLSHLRYNFDFQDPVAASQSLDACRPSLEDLYQRLSENQARSITPERFEQLVEDIRRESDVLLRCQADFGKCQAELTRMKECVEHAAIECPSCHNKFHLNYSEAEHRRTQSFYDALSKRIEISQDALKTLKKEHAEADAFFGMLNYFRQFSSHFPALLPYWSHVNSTGYLSTDPESLLRGLTALRIDLEYQVKIRQCWDRIKEQERLKSLLKESSQLDQNKLKEEKELLEHRIEVIYRQIATEEQERNFLQSRLALVSRLNAAQLKIQDQFTRRSESYRRMIENYCICVIDEFIHETKVALSTQERRLSQIDIQNALVNTLKVQLEELESQLKVTKLALKALSPSEGLIAKGMMGFINHVVKEFNSFISKIWLYPLEILPLSFKDEEVDLDYRFEVNVNEDHIVSDINKLSAGMMEVVDLAFVAVSMKYLGLGEYPIFLDEFAARMDFAHRQSAYRAIDYLIDSKDYSQVYLVSHYQDGYANLSNTQILVLCPENIQLPKHLAFNQHATLLT